MLIRFFFENPVPLAAGIGLVLFVLLVRWANRRDQTSARALGVGFFGGAALLALSLLVTTDTELVVRKCREIARAIDDGDISGVGDFLSEDFHIGELDREAFIERLGAALTRYRVDHPKLRRFEVRRLDPQTMEAVFHAAALLRSANSTLGQLPTRWRVTLRQASGGWKVTGLESIPIPPLNLRDVGEWLR